MIQPVGLLLHFIKTVFFSSCSVLLFLMFVFSTFNHSVLCSLAHSQFEFSLQLTVVASHGTCMSVTTEQAETKILQNLFYFKGLYVKFVGFLSVQREGDNFPVFVILNSLYMFINIKYKNPDSLLSFFFFIASNQLFYFLSCSFSVQIRKLQLMFYRF